VDSCIPTPVECELSLIEFVRLSLSFAPKLDDGGVVRLYSLDRPTLFVPLPNEVPAAVLAHGVGVPFRVFLTDSAQQFYMLVPNYGVHCPQVVRRTALRPTGITIARRTLRNMYVFLWRVVCT
jgi:hypothetical protein